MWSASSSTLTWTPAQGTGVPLDQVDTAARGGHHDVRVARPGDLGADGHSAVHGGPELLNYLPKYRGTTRPRERQARGGTGWPCCPGLVARYNKKSLSGIWPKLTPSKAKRTFREHHSPCRWNVGPALVHPPRWSRFRCPSSMTSQLPRWMRGPSATVTQLVFGKDGQMLSAAGLDKVVRVWTLKNGTFVLKSTFHVPLGPGTAGALNAVALSPDGAWHGAGRPGTDSRRSRLPAARLNCGRGRPDAGPEPGCRGDLRLQYC